jgi:hypothetical protein
MYIRINAEIGHDPAMVLVNAAGSETGYGLSMQAANRGRQ